MKYAKYIRRTAVVLTGLLLAAFGLAYFAAPYMILTPRKYHLARTPADLGLPFEKIEVETSDSLTLRGYWVHRPGDSDKTAIILLHGVGGCKEHWLETAAWLWEEGYESVFFDNRAHGESDGEYCTYGFYEKHDVSAITDYVIHHKNGGLVGVWGNSLGGAIALQAMAEDPCLDFGIVQSTFADFRTIVFDYQQQRLKIPWRWFADDGIARAKAIAQFEPDSIRPAEAAKRIQQPVFLAHGDADTRIKPDYGREIFANLASDEKQLHIVPGAGHLNLMARGGTAFKATLIRFLNQLNDSQPKG